MLAIENFKGAKEASREKLYDEMHVLTLSRDWTVLENNFARVGKSGLVAILLLCDFLNKTKKRDFL